MAFEEPEFATDRTGVITSPAHFTHFREHRKGRSADLSKIATKVTALRRYSPSKASRPSSSKNPLNQKWEIHSSLSEQMAINGKDLGVIVL
jgi:hypothetical protein